MEIDFTDGKSMKIDFYQLTLNPGCSNIVKEKYISFLLMLDFSASLDFVLRYFRKKNDRKSKIFCLKLMTVIGYIVYFREVKM